ncbi:MAG: F0F1 ATP synthase subunit A [Opitutales bacterium]|nr:F0F1 ATP synthase subunit A [Opitutales bacterium]
MFLKKVKFLTLFLAFLGVCSPLLCAADTKAAPLFESFPWVTNSMVTTWIVCLLLVFLIRLACGRPSAVPSRGQFVVETILDLVKEMLEPIVGRRALPAVFPLLVCFFIFILAQNWAGLIPGVGTVGFEESGEFVPLLRPLGADMNGTLALALISFGAWFAIVIRFAGFGGLLKDLFGNKADRKEIPALMYYFLSIIFIGVGCIDLISIAFRPVSLSFRLFGNVFGGEVLLHSTGYVFVFYFLELLVGLVQALVFTLLSAVYIGLLTNHEEHEAAHETA